MDAVLSLLLTRGSGGEYDVNVIGSSTGGANTRFRSPVDAVLGALDAPLEVAGQLLFETLLSGEVYNTFIESRAAARQQRQRLQLQLHMTRAPELAQLPWEAMYDPREQAFLAKSGDVSIVRFLALSRPVIPLGLLPPLRILVMAATPQDQIDVSAGDEALKLRQNLARLTEAGVLAIDQVRGGSATDLQSALAGGEYHALHFIGHGGTNEQGEGVLYFERPVDRGSDLVTAETLSGWLGLHPSLRLVVLNTCEGAKASSVDPFSGTAQKLVQSGLPAVVGMQYPISDEAALEFATGFYHKLERYAAIDDAVDSGRAAIRNDIEWATPVTYLRSRRPFVTPPPPTTRQLMRFGAGRSVVNALGLAKPGAQWPVAIWAAVSALLAVGSSSLFAVDLYREYFNLTALPLPFWNRALTEFQGLTVAAAMGGLAVAACFSRFERVRRFGITEVGYPATGRIVLYALAAAVAGLWFVSIPPTLSLTVCPGRIPPPVDAWGWGIDASLQHATAEPAYRRLSWFVGRGNRSADLKLLISIAPIEHVHLDRVASTVRSSCDQGRRTCSVDQLLVGHFDPGLRFSIATQASREHQAELPRITTLVRVEDTQQRILFKKTYESHPLFVTADTADQCVSVQ